MAFKKNVLKIFALSMVALSLLVWGVSCQRATPKGLISMTWTPATTPETELIRKALMEAGFPAMAERVNEKLILPKNLVVLFQNKDGPLYDRAQNVIFFSYDFVQETQESLLKHGICATEEEALQAAIQTAAFVFVHELTHALIQNLDLPVLAPEEDIADGLASVAAGTIMERPELALSTANSLKVLEKSDSPNESQYWSLHALDKQRFYRIVSLAYGSHPERVGPMIKERNLVPEEWWTTRAPSCVEEYKRLRNSWHQVLEPHHRGAGFTKL